MGFFCYSKCVLSINEIISGIKLATRIITPTKRLKWPTKLKPNKAEVVILPRTISTGIKNGIVIKRPRIDPFLRLRAFPRDKKLIKIRFEIIKHSKAIELMLIEIFKDKINRKATKARGMPINTQWTRIL